MFFSTLLRGAIASALTAVFLSAACAQQSLPTIYIGGGAHKRASAPASPQPPSTASQKPPTASGGAPRASGVASRTPLSAAHNPAAAPRAAVAPAPATPADARRGATARERLRQPQLQRPRRDRGDQDPDADHQHAGVDRGGPAGGDRRPQRERSLRGRRKRQRRLVRAEFGRIQQFSRSAVSTPRRFTGTSCGSVLPGFGSLTPLIPPTFKASRCSKAPRRCSTGETSRAASSPWSPRSHWIHRTLPSSSRSARLAIIAPYWTPPARSTRIRPCSTALREPSRPTTLPCAISCRGTAGTRPARSPGGRATGRSSPMTSRRRSSDLSRTQGLSPGAMLRYPCRSTSRFRTPTNPTTTC